LMFKFNKTPLELCSKDFTYKRLRHSIPSLWLPDYGSHAAITDATLIENAARPRTHVEAPPEDRAENEAPSEPATVIFSADNDARWVKKGRKSTLGYKGFSRCDEEEFVDKVHTTPANVGERPQCGTTIKCFVWVEASVVPHCVCF
jgi:IS5 family transposase